MNPTTNIETSEDQNKNFIIYPGIQELIDKSQKDFKFGRSESRLNLPKTFFTMSAQSKSQSFDRYMNLSTSKLDDFKLLTGKNKGRTFKDLMENEPKYAMWVNSNSRNTKNNLGLFKFYLQKKLYENSELSKNDFETELD